MISKGPCSGTALPGWSLGPGRCGRLRLDRADDQLGVGRARDDVELHAIALAVAVGPRGADFERITLAAPSFLMMTLPPSSSL